MPPEYYLNGEPGFGLWWNEEEILDYLQEFTIYPDRYENNQIPSQPKEAIKGQSKNNYTQSPS